MRKWMSWGLVALAAGLGAYVLLSGLGGSGSSGDARTSRAGMPAKTPATEARKAGAPTLRVQEGAEPAEAPATRPPIPEGGLRIVGQVVTPDGKPATGAQVDLLMGTTTTPAVATAADGSFALDLTAEEAKTSYSGLLRARRDELVALRQTQIRQWSTAAAQHPIGPRIDAGTLTLKPGATLDLEAVTPAGTTGPVTFWIVRADMSNPAVHARLKADEAGRATAVGVPPGVWRILATAEGAGRGETYVKVPRSEPGVVRIEMPEERTGTLVVVDRETRKPVAGAHLDVLELVQMPGVNTFLGILPPLENPVTDEQGRYVFRGLAPRSSLTIYVTAKGYPPSNDNSFQGRGAAARTQLRRGEEETRVELARARTITWPVVAGPELPVPEDGTAVTLRPTTSMGPVRGTPALPRGVMQGGKLVVQGMGSGYVHAYAVAPDGALAYLFCKDGQTEGLETHFIPARTLEVTLRYPDGAPAAGLYVSTANQGNNPLAKPTPTDDSGVARLEGFYGGPRSLVQVRVSEGNSPWGGATIGTVDFSKGDAKLEATVRRAVAVTLRVRIDGEATIPPATETSPTGGLTLQFGGAYRFPDLQVDRERAELHFSWRPPPNQTQSWVNVSLQGYMPYAKKFDVPAEQEPIVMDVSLERAGSIRVSGRPPADKRQQRVQVQKWNDGKHAWETQFLGMMRMGGFAKFDAEQTCVLQPLPAGRYRVIDVANFVASEAVDVVVGADPPEVVLDASHAGFVRGTVDVPPGVDAKRLRVVADGGPDVQDPFRGYIPGGAPPPKGLWTWTNDKHEFWLRVPGTMSMKIHAEGLGLVPATDDGHATVKAPREGVHLRLVKGAMAHVRFAKVLTPHVNPGRPRPIQVGYFKGKAQGEPVKLVGGRLDAEGRHLEFDLPKPGTWTVWIDASPFRPVVLRDVTFGSDDVDLGTVDVDEGSKVTIEVLLKDGAAMPRLWAYATYEGTPAYNRRADSGKGTSFTLSGLGPGRFKLRVGSHMGGPGGLDEEIEVDGTTAIQRVLDLRK